MLCSGWLIFTSEHNYCDTDVFETIVFVSLNSHLNYDFPFKRLSGKMGSKDAQEIESEVSRQQD